MKKAVKKYTTFSKIRLSLFTRSYANHVIAQYVKTKYKIDGKLKPKELKKKFYSKKAIPEISRLSKVLNLKYAPLWKAIVLSKAEASIKTVGQKERVQAYLSIENELILLAVAKQRQSDYTNPDYEAEFALLSMAIERAVGNALDDIEDDYRFDQQSEELRRKYLYWYYKTAYKYKLPTIRIVPFVVRLIN